MAIPNKLGLPLRTVSTALGRLVTTTIATRGPGLTRIVSAIEEEVLDATVQRIVEEADKFPEDVHIARIDAGWHASVEDRNLQATIALINKSGRVLNKVHIAKNAEQQEPLRLRRPSHECPKKPVIEQKIVVDDDVLHDQSERGAPKNK